jgi:hypothetical protein
MRRAEQLFLLEDADAKKAIAPEFGDGLRSNP